MGYDSPDFSQQLESKSQEVCIATDSQTELKDSTPNENISFFPGQVDINEVKINQSRDIAKNNPEILTVEEIKSEEIELLDGEIQDESQALFATSERMENVTDFLDGDEQEKLNIQAHHQELKKRKEKSVKKKWANMKKRRGRKEKKKKGKKERKEGKKGKKKKKKKNKSKK